MYFILNLLDKEHHFNLQVILGNNQRKGNIVMLDQMVGVFYGRILLSDDYLFNFFICLVKQKPTHLFCSTDYLKIR